MAIKLATGANALETAKAVKAKVDELSKQFPHGMKAVVAFDTTPFVKLSIEEVVKTLGEAIVLVFLVMYLFLQNFRATLIPTMAVPVVLLGTFAILSAFGYSINTLTMFAVVLAIGLLVDDAIVVVENVERVMTEEGLSPKEATASRWGRSRRAGRYRTGAVGGVRADGLLQRFHRRDLPPVLDHDRVGDGAVRAGRDGLHAGAVRHPPETRGQKAIT
jgi:Cu/Ag efflux pump CusA